MFMRLFEVGILVVLGVAVFGRNRLPDSVRNVKKSARIMKSEVQAAADDVDLPEAKVIPGHVVPPVSTDADQN
jgi:Sec-independent protein translocase protein TatA